MEVFTAMEPKFLNYIKNDFTVLERGPLEKVCKMKKLELSNIKVSGRLDTIRDKIILEQN